MRASSARRRSRKRSFSALAFFKASPWSMSATAGRHTPNAATSIKNVKIHRIKWVLR